MVGRQGFVHYWELFHYWGVHYSESILYLKWYVMVISFFACYATSKNAFQNRRRPSHNGEFYGKKATNSKIREPNQKPWLAVNLSLLQKYLFTTLLLMFAKVGFILKWWPFLISGKYSITSITILSGAGLFWRSILVITIRLVDIAKTKSFLHKTFFVSNV